MGHRYFLLINFLENWITEFGSNISVCNEINDYECQIYVEYGDLFFSAEINPEYLKKK